MKVVVMGGTGRIGSRLVTALADLGHDVVAASPHAGIDVLTGAGLAGALQGADVVVDVLNSPSFEDTAVMTFFETSTRNLIAAETAAGVRHHVTLSIVGADRLPGSGYLRAKVRQEGLVAASGIPYSIVRATQFFEFLPGIADGATVDGVVRVPSVFLQPIAVADLAQVVATVAMGAPVNGTVEVGGPEQVRLDDLLRRELADRNDPRDIVIDPRAQYFGTELAERSLVADDGARLGATRFDEWLRLCGRQVGRVEVAAESVSVAR